MAQYEIQLKDLVRIAKKRKKIIIGCAVGLSLLSFLFALVQTPSPLFTATAKVKYDKSQTLAGLITTVFYWSPYDNIQSQIKIITSFPVLEKTAKALGLLEETVTSKEILTSKDYMSIISMLETQIEPEPEENTNIINIHVTAHEPEMAAALANAVAESYREYNIEEINKRTIDTKSFIEEQLEFVSNRLKEAEDTYRTFQEEKDIVALESQALLDLQYLAELELEYHLLMRENETLTYLKTHLSSGSLSSKKSFNINEWEDIHSTLYKLNESLQDLLLERDQLLAIYTTNHPKIKELNGKISEVLSLIADEIDTRYDTNKARIATLQKDIELFREKTAKYPDENLTLARFEREVELQTELYSELNSHYQEILIQESGMIEEVSIVTPALIPEHPINPPRTASSLVIGLIMGLLIGVFFAIVMENLDTSIGTIEDVESYLELPVLGVIPYVSSLKDMEDTKEREEEADPQKDSPIILFMNPKSQMVESYRSLRTNILFLNREKDVNLIMITSSSLQEGKTVNCINVAIALALGGYKTLLVEADLRRATIAKVFGIDKSPGLTDVILGSQGWQDVVKDINDIILSGFDMDTLIKSPELTNLNIITSGTFPTNPTELINSKQMSKFINEIKEAYDFVIFDCTPILPVTDAVLLSQKVEGVIILYEVGKIARGVLKRSKSHMEGVKANILGVILNGVRPEYGPEYYEYHYQYYYGEGEKPHSLSDWETVKEQFTRENLVHAYSLAKERISRYFTRGTEMLRRLFRRKKS
jgi:uncharacterized protein involved in exopolysaccharide biosynthesis/Mrp family chromosome partitioning ATPase